jgi:hypothetical protein
MRTNAGTERSIADMAPHAEETSNGSHSNLTATAPSFTPSGTDFTVDAQNVAKWLDMVLRMQIL